MTYRMSVSEIFERGIWEEFCKIKGISEWAANEGQVSNDEVFEFTEEEAIKLGLIRR